MENFMNYNKYFRYEIKFESYDKVVNRKSI